MKKLNHLCVYMLLVVCLSSCSSKPKDAKECVMQFLECLKKGDVKHGEKLSGIISIGNNGKTESLFTIAQKYNPNWDPKRVVFEEDSIQTDTIDSNEISVVRATYNGKEVKFYISYSIDDINKSYTVINTEGFLNIDASITYKNGINIKKGTYCKDFNFVVHCAADIDNVISNIKKIYNSKNRKETLFKLYPNAKKFGDYLIMDGGVPKIKDITVNMNSKWELDNFVVNCTEGKTFYVYSNGDSYTIENSKGLYDFDKYISEMCNKYHYEYRPATPSTDNDALTIANNAESRIKTLLYQKECIDYWKRVGLVIRDTRTVRGKDNNNYPTTGISITLFNPTNKNIKYLEFYTVARNSVDDIIGRERCRGIGPIEPQESGTYSFDNLYRDYNGIINKVSVVSVGITYTDGSRKTAKWSEVSADSDSSEEFNAYWW